ncbi:MAG: hypothetical protein R3F20_06695 [Planctomycetota bacterium]
MTPNRVFALLAVFLIAAAARAQDAPPPLDPEIAAQVATALAAEDPRDQAEALWRRAVLRHGDVDELLADLAGRGEGALEGEAGAGARRARRLAARVMRIRGDLEPAVQALTAIPAAERLPADSLALAELLDAQGKTKEAIEGYEAMLASGPLDAELEKTLRLRVALMKTEKTEGLSALAAFAKDAARTPDQRNEAAVVLALRNEQKDALEIFEVRGTDAERYRDFVRLTEWALEAKENEKAQEFAWNAVRSAKLQRDRRYALTLLVEAYRRGKALPALVERFEATEDLDPQSREVWIDLLRETGQTEKASELFRGASEGHFTVEMRRELLEMGRESGDDAALEASYRDLIAAEPRFLEWREGLSRHFLEKGDREQGRAVWEGYENATDDRRYLMAAAATTADLGLDDLAERFARAVMERHPEGRDGALLFLFENYETRGRGEDALAVLDELDRVAAPDAPARKDLAESFDRIGRTDRAVKVLEGLRAALGDRAGSDLEMKLALKLSEVDREDDALDLWYALWRNTNSVPRRRYVEDRLMTVASRLGKLARIAVDIERKLDAGEATELEAGLLVRLYTKVNDPVSATEVIEEFMLKSGKADVDVLAEKARIFLTCDDYYNYEKTVEQMVAADPENRSDYLRQLAMSKLERGKRDEASALLVSLKDTASDSAADEFEAGVLALAGMREEALVAYRRGLARHPERIDGYLLLSNTMKELGQHARSAAMFQFLAATADKDDLFTIAIDGILNMRDGRRNIGAPDSLVKWARRIALERVAMRPDKFYLYQLVADLSEEVRDTGMAIRALKSALPIAGERRTPLLRELMALAKGKNGPGGGVTLRIVNGVVVEDRPKPQDQSQRLMFGRRLLGQGEQVPPGVYLELGEAFLDEGEVDNALRTFNRASKLPEFDEIRRNVAALLVNARYPEDALATYRKILSVETDDIGVIRRVANLEEQLGRDGEAWDLYRRAMDLYFQRKPEHVDVAGGPEIDPDDPFGYYRAVNVDESETEISGVRDGILAVLPFGDEGRRYLLEREAEITRELETLGDEEGSRGIARFPRLAARASHLRRVALATGEITLADRIDERLLARFSADAGLAETVVRQRLRRGFVASARQLADRAVKHEPSRRRLRLLAGGGAAEDVPGLIGFAEASGLLLPALAEGRLRDARLVLARLDVASASAEVLPRMPILIAAANFLGDRETGSTLLRTWLDLMGQNAKVNLYQGLSVLLDEAKRSLDEAGRRDVIQYLVDAIVDKPDRFRNLMGQLPQLQREFGERLLTDEQAEKLITSRLEAADNFIYGIPELFFLVGAERRESLLRTIWTKIPKAQRAYFVVQLVPELDETVSDGFSEFLAGAFSESFGEADNPDMFQYYVPDLIESCPNNLATAERIVAVYEKTKGEDVALSAARAAALAKLGREEDGLALARKILLKLFAMPSNDYNARRRQEQLLTAYREQLDEFVAVVDAEEREKGASKERTDLRLRLLESADAGPRVEAALAAAIEAHPDDGKYPLQLAQRLRTRGETLRALEIQTAWLEHKPDDGSTRKQVERGWRSIGNPVKALEIRKGAPEEKGKEAAAAPTPGDPGLPAGVTAAVPMTALAVGGTIVVAGGVVGEEAEESDEDEEAVVRPRMPVPSPKLVKDHLEKEEVALARRDFRRLWRVFPAEGRSPFGFIYRSGGRRHVWPKDPEKKEEKAKQPQRRRVRFEGGMPASYREAPKEAAKATPPAPPVYIHEALRNQPFAEEEFRRQLRLLDGAALDGELANDIYHALASLRVEREGREAALKSALADERAGLAGKPDYGVLFVLLDEASREAGVDQGEVLERLLRSIPASDTTQMRRLARLFARSGRDREAEVLYRWSALLPPAVVEYEPGTAIFYGRNQNSGLKELITEIEETIVEPEARLRIIDALLAAEEPSLDDSWARDQWTTVVLSTWERLVGPEETLRRTGPLVEQILAAEGQTPPREGAKRLVRLLSGQGDYDRAVRAFEIAFAKLEAPATLTVSWYRENWTRPGWIDDRTLLEIFPYEWPRDDAGEWPARAADALLSWLDADRVDEDRAFRVLALLAVRLGAAERPAEARRVFGRLRALAGESLERRHWIADVARHQGDEREAREIELDLLARGALIPGRIPRLLGDILTDWGPTMAIRFGEPVLAWSRDPDVLEVLVEAAMMGRGEAAREREERFLALEAESEAAARELWEMDEKERREKEAAAAAKKKADEKRG